MRDLLAGAVDADARESAAESAFAWDTPNLVVTPSLDFRRLDLRLDESRAVCCGEVSAEVPDEGLPVSVMCPSSSFIYNRTQHWTSPLLRPVFLSSEPLLMSRAVQSRPHGCHPEPSYACERRAGRGEGRKCEERGNVGGDELFGPQAEGLRLGFVEVLFVELALEGGEVRFEGLFGGVGGGEDAVVLQNRLSKFRFGPRRSLEVRTEEMHALRPCISRLLSLG